jgi:hypothetical protein
MKEKPNYYAILTSEVRYSKALTPNAKLLYAELTALCNMNGKCTASTEYFCRLYEVSRVSVQKWLKNLEDNGHIKRVNIYRQGSKEILTRVITLVNTPSKEKLTDNTNIHIVNTNLTDSNNKALFKKPTLNDIINYCTERKNNIDAETFFNFYETNGWMQGKGKPIVSWKACIVTWEKREKSNPKSMSKLDAQINEWQKAKDLL